MCKRGITYRIGAVTIAIATATFGIWISITIIRAGIFYTAYFAAANRTAKATKALICIYTKSSAAIAVPATAFAVYTFIAISGGAVVIILANGAGLTIYTAVGGVITAVIHIAIIVVITERTCGCPVTGLAIYASVCGFPAVPIIFTTRLVVRTIGVIVAIAVG